MLCAAHLWHTESDALRAGVANMIALRKATEASHKQYWEDTARAVDHWARILVPTSYIATLVVLFQIRFDDPYPHRADDPYPNQNPMDGLGSASIVDGGWTYIGLLLTLPLLAIAAWVVFGRLDAAERQRLKDEERQAVYDASKSVESMGLDAMTERSERVGVGGGSPAGPKAKLPRQRSTAQWRQARGMTRRGLSVPRRARSRSCAVYGTGI